MRLHKKGGWSIKTAAGRLADRSGKLQKLIQRATISAVG